MRFPLDHVPAESWLVEPRKFGARRSGTTRLHGAVDLHAPIGTPVYAIQDGLVGPACGYSPTFPHPYKFYGANDYALEVTSHDGSGIWRYCELHFVPEMRVGHGVKEGDLLGHIANLGLSNSMLHLELYAKTVNGPLTDRTSPGLYGRRADLVDLTAIVSRLAEEWAARNRTRKESFGVAAAVEA